MKILVFTEGVVRSQQVSLIEDAFANGRRVSIDEVQRPGYEDFAKLKPALAAGKYDAVVLLNKGEKNIRKIMEQIDGLSSTPVYFTDYTRSRSNRGDHVVEFDGFTAAA